MKKRMDSTKHLRIYPGKYAETMRAGFAQIKRTIGRIVYPERIRNRSAKERQVEVDGRGKETEEPLDTWLKRFAIAYVGHSLCPTITGKARKFVRTRDTAGESVPRAVASVVPGVSL